MSEEPGLRERKKRRTHAAISDAAISLFLQHGFDQVSVAQVAEAAEVSRRTLFAYFPAKEDLVVHRMADHQSEGARVVLARPPGTSPLAALRANFLTGLDRRDPITGLSDHPHIHALFAMILSTPALVARMERFKSAAEHTLAEALRQTSATPELTARLAAAQLVAVQWTLALDNIQRLAGGQSADDRHPGAVSDAEHAYTLLRTGLGDLT
ncbi:TetR/AcrR family transcriptional regulator [Sphaerisporangium corydalis]|uniref:TetR/AcrR family transcriptional regulator n=1 Tax=Sphaerisporangium corydalis TaxID=1441875 RepID=A0ABV9EHT7_9ACTN|nr:TetR/AcrR family transcriptional regulator [Sphaerisporangium corydalis]